MFVFDFLFALKKGALGAGYSNQTYTNLKFSTSERNHQRTGSKHHPRFK